MNYTSLPSRERGLKRKSGSGCIARLVSLPSRERGLKQCKTCATTFGRASLPSRERGLKQCTLTGQIERRASLPSRERGLKQKSYRPLPDWTKVAPLAGAWIETSLSDDEAEAENGRSPRGSVD